MVPRAVPAYPIPFDSPNWCESPSHTVSAQPADPRHLTGSNGQACFWFNNGCDIGSEKCGGHHALRPPGSDCRGNIYVNIALMENESMLVYAGIYMLVYDGICWYTSMPRAPSFS